MPYTSRTKSKRSTAKRRFIIRKQGEKVSPMSYFNAMNRLEKKINNACERLTNHIRKNANISAIRKDRNQIALLLGECNYIARQCTHFQKKA